MHKLTAPRVRVLIENPDRDDYTDLVVQTDNRDACRWDRARVQNKWPSMTDAPMFWLTYMAWNALRRSGQFTGDQFKTYDAFEATCVEVQPVDEDGNAIKSEQAAEAAAPLDPTP